DFWKMLRISGLDSEDELGASTLADDLLDDEEVREYLEGLTSVPYGEYRIGDLAKAVEADIHILEDLHASVEPLVAKDAKLRRLKDLLAGELKGRKILIFTSFKDTARYLQRGLGEEAWLKRAGA